MPTPPFEDDRDFSENSEQRVQRIVTRARRRVAVRDLIAFGAGKVWLAAVAVGGALLALVLRANPNRD
jgi:hypothetical protein